MINRKVLTRDQVFSAINEGEFGTDVIAASEKVAVVLTQDWCPQWHSMNNWIYGIKTEEEIDVFELIYNKTDYHREFMNFKENTWGNYHIPYLRYYKGGKLIKTSNYVSQSDFKNILEIK